MLENPQFTALAAHYDKLNGADYKKYAKYIKDIETRYGGTGNNLALELGCGTGSLTLELAELEYDMIGADISAEMLNVAMDRAYDAEKSILFLLQDMREFELYGSVGMIACALDGLNYLPDQADVLKTMKLVNNYLDPGGVFIFDVNTPWKFRNVFAKRDFFTEDGSSDVYLGWRSYWDEKRSKCDFLLTLFVKNEDGTYTKREEEQTEYMWTREQLCQCIEQAGLELIAVHSDTDATPAVFGDGEEKWFFVCRKRA